jgi:type I restriction enzyme S subunit
MKQWTTKPLGDLVDFIGGGTPRRNRPEYWSGSIPWASVKDLSSQSLDTTVESITQQGLEQSASNLIPTGTVIVASRVGLGKVAINQRQVAINQDLKALIIRHNNLLPRYLLFFLLSKSEHLQRMGSGATVKGLTIAAYQKLDIPLPPSVEQKRIVDLLDEADEMRKLRARADGRTEALIPALFNEMFGDLISRRKQWPVVKIGDICDVKGGKRLPKGDEYSAAPTLYRYIRVRDIHQGSVDEDALQFITPDTYRQIARYIVNEGDLIISIAGTIGMVAPVGKSLGGANLTENAAKLVSRSGGAYETIFLSEMMQLPAVQKQIRLHTGQVTIGKLALFRIEQISFSLPPLPLQQEFAKRVSEIRELEAEQAASRQRLDDLFQSTLHRAFSEEL